MPELHLLSGILGDWRGDAELVWNDPLAEVRYGAVKRFHEEVPILGDLLPHAFSVFEVLGGDARRRHWTLTDAGMQADRLAGRIYLESNGVCCALLADKAAPSRLRLLKLTCADGRKFQLDFSKASARVSEAGASIATPERWTALKSTLRLELGAWVAALSDECEAPAIVATLEDHIRLAGQLEAALR